MKDELQQYRKKINQLDSRILKLLEERFAVVKKVGEYKKKHGLPVRNAKREKELVAAMTEQSGLDPEFVKKLYKLIFNNSYKIEK